MFLGRSLRRCSEGKVRFANEFCDRLKNLNSQNSLLTSFLPILLLFAGILLLFPLFHHLHEPFHHCRVLVAEKRTRFRVQCGDFCHLVIAQCKVKDIEVFRHAFLVGRFWNHDNSSLQMPARQSLQYLKMSFS